MRRNLRSEPSRQVNSVRRMVVRVASPLTGDVKVSETKTCRKIGVKVSRQSRSRGGYIRLQGRRLPQLDPIMNALCFGLLIVVSAGMCSVISGLGRPGNALGPRQPTCDSQ